MSRLGVLLSGRGSNFQAIAARVSLCFSEQMSEDSSCGSIGTHSGVPSCLMRRRR